MHGSPTVTVNGLDVDRRMRDATRSSPGGRRYPAHGRDVQGGAPAEMIADAIREATSWNW